MPYMAFWIVYFLKLPDPAGMTWTNILAPKILFSELVFANVAIYLTVSTEWFGTISRTIEKGRSDLDLHIRRDLISFFGFLVKFLASISAFSAFVIYFADSLDNKGLVKINGEFNVDLTPKLILYFTLSTVRLCYAAFISVIWERRHFGHD